MAVWCHIPLHLQYQTIFKSTQSPRPHPPVQVHATRHDVCRHQDAQFERPEVRHSGHPLWLGAVCRQCCCWEAGGSEALAQPVGSWLAVAEYHRLQQQHQATR